MRSAKKIRVFTIIDTFTRLSPAIDVRQNYKGMTWSTHSNMQRPDRLSQDDAPGQLPAGKPGQPALG
jgi:hypothetical protein